VVEVLAYVIDLIVHVDMHLRNFIVAHGGWVYALLFAIIFIETGFVITPFLPGDSLLFVVGALCGLSLMSLPLAMLLLTVAAIAGNQCNYAVGRYFGSRVLHWGNSRLFNRTAFDLTHSYYEKYGGLTIVAARFLPLLRSFAPFVAGVAEMRRAQFTLYDVTGGALWVVSLTLAGYLFGNLPWVQEHLNQAIALLLAASVLIALVGSWRGRRLAAQKQPAALFAQSAERNDPMP
jgi:membrane-associated protein